MTHRSYSAVELSHRQLHRFGLVSGRGGDGTHWLDGGIRGRGDDLAGYDDLLTAC